MPMRATRLKVLPAETPVKIPVLPPYKIVGTPAQLKALGDPLRTRILGVIQQVPATAKQVADRLGKSPGSIGYQLKLLEKLDLVQVVALRTQRGIISRYYVRTARLFIVSPPTRRARTAECVSIGRLMLSELEEAAAANPDQAPYIAYPRINLGKARLQRYQQRLEKLVSDLLGEQPEADAESYCVGIALFRAPDYLQQQSPPKSRAPRR